MGEKRAQSARFSPIHYLNFVTVIPTVGRNPHQFDFLIFTKMCH